MYIIPQLRNINRYWLMGLLLNFLNLVWSSRIFFNFEWILVRFIEYCKNVCFVCFSMMIFGWLRNSLAAYFSCIVNNIDCFLLYRFLKVSALNRTRNSGLNEMTILSRNFEIFWNKISISVFLLMFVYPCNKLQLGPKLRKSFCCWVKLESKRLIYLSILFGSSKWPL